MAITTDDFWLYFCLFMGGAFIGGVILALLFRLGWLDALFSRGPAYMSLDQNWNQMLTPDEQHVTHLEKALESVQTELQGLQTKDRHSNSEWVVRCNALEEKIQELEQEKRESVEALENRIKASDIQSSSIASKLDSLQEQNSRLRETGVELSEENRKLEESIIFLRKQTSDATTAMRTTDDANKRLTKEKQAALDAKAQVEQAVTDLSQRLQEMEEEAHEMIELKEANDATKSVAEQMAKESEQHRRRAQKIEEEKSSLEMELGQMGADKQALEDKLAKLEKDISKERGATVHEQVVYTFKQLKGVIIDFSDSAVIVDVGQSCTAERWPDAAAGCAECFSKLKQFAATLQPAIGLQAMGQKWSLKEDQLLGLSPHKMLDLRHLLVELCASFDFVSKESTTVQTIDPKLSQGIIRNAEWMIMMARISHQVHSLDVVDLPREDEVQTPTEPAEPVLDDVAETKLDDVAETNGTDMPADDDVQPAAPMESDDA